jgi:hypothetical protein
LQIKWDYKKYPVFHAAVTCSSIRYLIPNVRCLPSRYLAPNVRYLPSRYLATNVRCAPIRYLAPNVRRLLSRYLSPNVRCLPIRCLAPNLRCLLIRYLTLNVRCLPSGYLAPNLRCSEPLPNTEYKMFTDSVPSIDCEDKLNRAFALQRYEGYTYRHSDWWVGFVEYVVDMDSGAIMHIPNFVKIGLGIKI